MKALIEIEGVIGDFGYEPKYTFTDLASDIKEAREKGATSFEFLINSDGGLVNEGFLMASYIQNLPEPTTATAINVFSIANVVYFACDTRDSEEAGMFMLHQAWGGVEGNSNELREYASLLDKENDRIASYIASRTGLDFDAVIGLMGTDRFIGKQEAERLGFFNQVKSLQMAALYTKKEDSMSNKLKDALNTIAKFAGVNMSDEEEPKDMEAVNMELTLEDGAMIYVESEDGELEGKATDAPDGTHRLQDGRSITVEGGIVTSVQEDAVDMDGEDEEKQAMKEQIADLQAQLSEAVNMNKTHEAKQSALEEKLEFIAKNMSTTKEVPAKHKRFNQENQNGKPADKVEAAPKSSYNRIVLGEKISTVAQEIQNRFAEQAKQSLNK